MRAGSVRVGSHGWKARYRTTEALSAQRSDTEKKGAKAQEMKFMRKKSPSGLYSGQDLKPSVLSVSLW